MIVWNLLWFFNLYLIFLIFWEEKLGGIIFFGYMREKKKSNYALIKYTPTTSARSAKERGHFNKGSNKCFKCKSLSFLVK